MIFVYVQTSQEFEAECKGENINNTDDVTQSSAEVAEDQLIEEFAGQIDADLAEFDWNQFGDILKPYWKLMTVAVGVSTYLLKYQVLQTLW